MKRLAIKVAAAGALGVGAAFLSIGSSEAAGFSICHNNIPENQIECSFFNPLGIQSVFITLSTDDGLVVAVNETYDCESPVSVAWENLGPTHHFEVEPCLPDPAVPPPDDLPIAQKPLPAEPRERLASLRDVAPVPALVGLLGEPSSAETELLILIRPEIVK